MKSDTNVHKVKDRLCFSVILEIRKLSQKAFSRFSYVSLVNIISLSKINYEQSAGWLQLAWANWLGWNV